MKKLFILSISLITLGNLNGQVEQQSLPTSEEISNRRTSFNLDEIKVRWKKAALENCTGVPCPAPFSCGTSTVADIDGNTYNTVLIGTQCWTKSNLKVTKYNDGTAIPLAASGGTNGITGGETWSTQPEGARTVYEHDNNNLNVYGYLYNHDAVRDSRKICPSGWHVPSDSEWNTLMIAIDPTGITSIWTQSLIAGGKMKSTTLWNSPNTGADNSSGFSALPSGQRYTFGFQDKGNLTKFWSTNLFPGAINDFSNRVFVNNNSSMDWDYLQPKAGLSVSCLKD